MSGFDAAAAAGEAQTPGVDSLGMGGGIPMKRPPATGGPWGRGAGHTHLPAELAGVWLATVCHEAPCQDLSSHVGAPAHLLCPPACSRVQFHARPSRLCPRRQRPPARATSATGGRRRPACTLWPLRWRPWRRMTCRQRSRCEAPGPACSLGRCSRCREERTPWPTSPRDPLRMVPPPPTGRPLACTFSTHPPSPVYTCQSGSSWRFFQQLKSVQSVSRCLSVSPVGSHKCCPGCPVRYRAPTPAPLPFT